LTVRLWKEDKHILFSVTDTGCGISDENMKRLFTPFFTTKPKASEATHGAPTGTGLGLSTSRTILAKFGAEISAESKPGRGSTFFVKFPMNRKYTATA
jgi:signal transduction histidine kinase